MAPLDVAVVVPAYNAAATLPETLAALARQTYDAGRVEVVVVDDGSSDGTAAVAARFGITVVRQENRGPAAARNAGVAASAGHVVVFTDADCVPEPDFLAALVAPLLADPGVAGAQGAYRTTQTSLTARFAQCEFEDRYAYASRFPCLDLVATYAAAFRRDVFEAAGGFDAAFTKADNEDTELSYRLCRLGRRLVFAPEARVAHRHPATLGRYLRVKAGRAYWRLRACRNHPEKLVRDGYTPPVIRFQTALGAVCLGGVALWPVLGGAVAAGAAAGIMLSSLPFARFAARRDSAVGLLAPGFVLARSLAFAAGALAGAARRFAPGSACDASGGGKRP
ncbi:glycosyltransferase [Solidesulfovibrio sp.]|uniref:glycosyltransferase n=1 Tax=Solidesulfovibrio sp. TaxID=2910990 RepID=UPI0026109DC4|nr:glycosyltransferase [Solidesulfovibrio sp.]